VLKTEKGRIDIVACLLGNATVIMDSGFGNSIYWILTVITTFIHFTTLQHINQRLIFWFGFTPLPT
jgi:hypothetical protein